MEHRTKGRKLKRTASHRKALLSNLSISLIKHKRINTTLAKAKELRTVIEPLVTKSIIASGYAEEENEKAVHLRREARKIVKDKEALNILFGEIAPKVKGRNGGYTRIIKTGFRKGDGGETAIIEFVDYDVTEEAKTREKEKEAKEKDKKKSKTASGTKEKATKEAKAETDK